MPGSPKNDYSLIGIGICLIAIVAQVLIVRAANAEELPTSEVQQLAEEYNLDPIELQGAVNTTRLTPLDYVRSQNKLGDTQSNTRVWTVRLTYYTLRGRTFSGESVHLGGTACSWNFPIGTRFRFSNGEQVVCNDRGLLGSYGWLDVWLRPDLIRLYGDYTTVEVLP